MLIFSVIRTSQRSTYVFGVLIRGSLFTNVMSSSSPTEFEYVVKDIEAPKVAFGSGQPRDILPAWGTSKFLSVHTHGKVPQISPSTYNVKEVPCVKKEHWGYGGLGRTDVRSKPGTWINIPINTNPGPGDFEIRRFPSIRKHNKIPFNSNSPKIPPNRNKLPGPGTYHITRPRDRRIKFDHSFGGPKKLHPAADIKCDRYYNDICEICQEVPVGDYWHLHDKEFLCRQCMAIERKALLRYKPWQIEQFRRVRDCSFMHHHDFTHAAIITMEPKVARRMLTTEAYFSRYFP